jgi:hypothetical protein
MRLGRIFFYRVTPTYKTADFVNGLSDMPNRGIMKRFSN